MTTPVTPELLRAALARHRTSHDEADVALQALATALESIGWRGGDTVEADEVAELLLPHLDACAGGHQQMAVLHRDVAGVLRSAGPLLDGGLPPVSDYLPAAEEVVRLFVGLG